MAKNYFLGRTLRQVVGENWIEEMQEATGNRCWICMQPESLPNRSLAIDHCHETNRVRGLLCTRCNRVLGFVGDDPELLRRMILYLVKARGRYPFEGDELATPTPSKITHVAIRFRGSVYALPPPNRTHHVFAKVKEETGVNVVDWASSEGIPVRWGDDGFLDERGVFLNRRQALVSATLMGQIKPDVVVRGESLFSCYIW